MNYGFAFRIAALRAGSSQLARGAASGRRRRASSSTRRTTRSTRRRSTGGSAIVHRHNAARVYPARRPAQTIRCSGRPASRCCSRGRTEPPPTCASPGERPDRSLHSVCHGAGSTIKSFVERGLSRPDPHRRVTLSVRLRERRTRPGSSSSTIAAVDAALAILVDNAIVRPVAQTSSRSRCSIETERITTERWRSNRAVVARGGAIDVKLPRSRRRLRCARARDRRSPPARRSSSAAAAPFAQRRCRDALPSAAGIDVRASTSPFRRRRRPHTSSRTRPQPIRVFVEHALAAPPGVRLPLPVELGVGVAPLPGAGATHAPCSRRGASPSGDVDDVLDVRDAPARHAAASSCPDAPSGTS